MCPRRARYLPAATRRQPPRLERCFAICHHQLDESTRRVPEDRLQLIGFARLDQQWSRALNGRRIDSPDEVAFWDSRPTQDEETVVACCHAGQHFILRQ